MLLAEPPNQAIVSMQESRYGYSIVDVGITPSHLFDFDQIQIEEDHIYISLGVPSSDDLIHFLTKIGPNDPTAMSRVALKITEITEQILLASTRETVCMSLRSFTPTHHYDLPRWHMDGQYYKPTVKGELQYRFVLTLVGPSTLFYPLSSDLMEFRKSVWNLMSNRKLMAEMFECERAFSPSREKAVFLIGGSSRRAALHSEPPIHGTRLFLSLIPCSKQDLKTFYGAKYE
jgi:hypothetical protein